MSNLVTPVYDPIDHNHPVISNPKINTETWARNNIVNLRDFLILTGYMPGWSCSASGTDSTQPTSYIFTKGVEALKYTITWGANNLPSKVWYYYSTDNKTTWQPLTDAKGNYVATYTWDTSEYCTAKTWGTS